MLLKFLAEKQSFYDIYLDVRVIIIVTESWERLFWVCIWICSGLKGKEVLKLYQMPT